MTEERYLWYTTKWWFRSVKTSRRFYIKSMNDCIRPQLHCSKYAAMLQPAPAYTAVCPEILLVHPIVYRIWYFRRSWVTLVEPCNSRSVLLCFVSSQVYYACLDLRCWTSDRWSKWSYSGRQIYSWCFTLLFLYCCSKIDSLFLLSVILQWQNSWASEAVLLTLTASAT